MLSSIPAGKWFIPMTQKTDFFNPDSVMVAIIHEVFIITGSNQIKSEFHQDI